jgi:hypothetical protein
MISILKVANIIATAAVQSYFLANLSLTQVAGGPALVRQQMPQL